MANETIDVAQIIQFSDMVHQEAQQLQARFRPWTKIKQMTGDVFAYDGLGTVEATEVIGRHQSSTPSDIEHRRRKISRRRFVVTLWIDGSDVRGMLLNPEGEYAQACARAMERCYDRIMAEAAFASVYTGRDFGTTVTASTDGVLTVTGTGGLTYEDLLDVKSNFTGGEVGTDVKEAFCLAITEDEEKAMMKENQLTSGDFSRQYPIDNGEITKALGMSLLKFGSLVSRPVLNVSGGVRDCIALAKGAICAGMSKEFAISIKDRPDLIETTQVQVIYEFGAVRTEGKLVQKLNTDE